MESKEGRNTSRDLRFLPLAEHRDAHLATVGQKKGRQSERLPNSERAAKGARVTQSLPPRRKHRCAKLSRCTLPSRLGKF